MVLDLIQEETFYFLIAVLLLNVINFGADMSSSVHANDKTKGILVLGEGVTQGFDNATLTAKNIYIYSFSFTKSNTEFCF